MADYLFYTYFDSGREYFVYKDLTFERSHTKEKDFPFRRIPLAKPELLTEKPV